MAEGKQEDQGEAEATTWDDDTIRKKEGGGDFRKLDRFRGKQGQTYRFAIVDENPIKVQQHYHRGGFGYLRCIRPLQMKCAACEAGDKSNPRLGVNIIMYPSAYLDGVPEVDGKPGVFDASGVKVLAFFFGSSAFVDLRNIRSEWGDLRKHDLKVQCTNEQYQHLSFTVCKDALYLADKTRAIEVAKIVRDQRFDLKKILGKHYSEEDTAKIWAGTLSRDDLKARREKDKPKGKQAEAKQEPAEKAEAEPPTPESVDFESLLGSID